MVGGPRDASINVNESPMQTIFNERKSYFSSKKILLNENMNQTPIIIITRTVKCKREKFILNIILMKDNCEIKTVPNRSDNNRPSLLK